MKMITREDKKYYFRNFQLALITSLAISILAFVFFPKFENTSVDQTLAENFVIHIDDIPATRQSGESSEKRKPEAPKILIASEIDEPRILNDVKIPETGDLEKDADEQNGNSGLTSASVSGGINPRQILEVLPKKGKDFKGRINLSLKLNEEGNVTAHKILSNTTTSAECLEQVLEAAYKSKWEPFLNNQTELWVEKSYNFN